MLAMMKRFQEEKSLPEISDDQLEEMLDEEYGSDSESDSESSDDDEY